MSGNNLLCDTKNQGLTFYIKVCEETYLRNKKEVATIQFITSRKHDV